jgi:hypothetical protein
VRNVALVLLRFARRRMLGDLGAEEGSERIECPSTEIREVSGLGEFGDRRDSRSSVPNWTCLGGPIVKMGPARQTNWVSKEATPRNGGIN